MSGEAIRARRAAADDVYWLDSVSAENSEQAIERATIVTPEEFDRAYEVLMAKLGADASHVALKAAFEAAGFEVKP